MTREYAKELLPIIQAFANGEEIQINEGDNSNPQWVDIDCPTFGGYPPCYRIKPKPREFWIYRDNGDVWAVCEHQPSANWDQVIKLSEILD